MSVQDSRDVCGVAVRAALPSRRAAGRRDTGFSLVELLIVGFVVVIIAMIGFPALQYQLAKSRLLGSCEQVSMNLLRARFESLKRGLPVVARFELENQRLSAFVDDNEDGLLSGGEELLFSIDIPEAGSRTAFYPMGPDGVIGTTSDPARAIVGLSAVDGKPVARFRADGSIDDSGAFRFADGRQPQANVFEIRIEPRSTARIEIRKFAHADLGGSDPELGGSWYPRGGGKWKWY